MALGIFILLLLLTSFSPLLLGIGCIGLLLIMLIPWNGINIWSYLYHRGTWIIRRKRFFPSTFSSLEPIMTDSTPWGIMWDCYGNAIIAVHITPDHSLLSITDDPRQALAVYFSLTNLGEMLTLYDITLEDISLVTSYRPFTGNVKAAQSYRSFLSDSQRLSHQDTWITFTFNPDHNVAPIARRGKNTTSIIATIHSATQRIITALIKQGFNCELLSVEQLKTLYDSMTDKHTPWIEHWDCLLHNETYYRYEILSPDLFSSEIFSQIAQIHSLVTTVICTAFINAQGKIHYRAIIIFQYPLSEQSSPSFPLLSSSITPNGYQQLLHSAITSDHTDKELSYLRAPATIDLSSSANIHIPVRCQGQIIGINIDHQLIVATIISAYISHVDIAADIQLVKQLLVRSLAIGERIAIYTTRPHIWMSMSNTINSPRDFIILPAKEPTWDSQLISHYTGVVLDIDNPPTLALHPHVTYLMLHPRGTPLHTSKSRIIIEQASNDPSMIRLHYDQHELWVHITVSPQELTLTGSTHQKIS